MPHVPAPLGAPPRWVPVAFWIALLALLAIGINVGRNLHEAQTQATLRLQVRELLLESKDLVSSLKDARIGAQCLLVLAGDPRCLQTYDTAVAEIGQRVDNIERLTLNPGVPAFDLQQLRPLLSEQRAALDPAVRAFREGGLAAALPQLRDWRSAEATDAATGLIDAQVRAIERMLDARVGRSNDRLTSALSGLLVGGTLSAALLLLGFARLRHEVHERGRTAVLLARSKESIEQQVNERTASLLAANEALRTSEAFVRNIGDNLPGGMIYQLVIDTEGNPHYEYVSAGVQRLHGVTMQAVLDHPNLFYDQIVEEDRPAWLAARAEANRTGQAFSIDARIRRPDGEVRWSHFTSSRRLLPDGRALWYGVELDITDRKRAQADHEQLLRRVSDGVFSLDAQWRFTYLDLKVAQTFARTPEALRGRDIWAEFPPFLRTSFHAACHKALQEQRFRLSEDYNPAIDRWFECRIYPARDGVTVFASDVTDSKRAERATRENEARLRLALEASNTGLWEWKAGSEEVYYSPLLKRHMGYEDHEIANHADTWQQHIHPEDLAATRSKVAASTHPPWPRYENEYRLRHKDGKYRWIRATGAMLLDEKGQPLRLLGTQQDITGARQAQAEREHLLSEQLRARAEAGAANERLVHVLESVSDAFVALDRDWRFVFVNENAAQTFGRKSEDLVGKNIWTEFPGVAGLPFQRAYAEAMERRTFIFLEEYYPPTRRWFENRIYPSAEGISIFFHDISDRKRAEAALRITEAQLHELLAQRQRAQEAERIRISRQIHDELGQLLTGVKMDLRWLERKLAEPEVPPHLNALLDRAVAASELNDQTIATVQRIAAELRPSALDQLGLTAALTQAARHFEARSGLTCTVSVPPVEPAVSAATANEFFYICQEALTNVARHADATEVEIELCALEGGVMLEVRDNGVGIDVAMIYGRHSLGLLGMRERALQCGGTLQVHRIEPCGTRVSVRVPVTKAEPGSAR